MKNAQKFMFKLLVLSILLLSFSNCREKEPTTKVIEEPKEMIISLEQAKKMYDTYTERRKPLIQAFEDNIDSITNYDPKRQKMMQNQEDQKESEGENSTQKDPKRFRVARYGDFDYKTLKQYLAYIEQEARDAGVENISTLRLYFANYPDQDKFEEGRKVKDRRRNTFIMIPTLKKDGGNYAFFTQDGKEGGRQPLLLTDSLEINPNDGLGEFNYLRNQRNEASFFPKNMFANAPIPPPGVHSTAGNEAGLRPPSAK